jgi:hypothetical protein
MPAANYYIDLTNGNDARTGLKIGNSTIDSTADTTHFVDDALTGADDYINGSYFYNVTRSLGSLISDFVALTDTVTLTDAIAGMTAGDTYYILDSWLTLQQYTTTTARTAGDIAYVRANTIQTAVADIVFDEDGTAVAPISIIGCDAVTNDPWQDASNVLPIITFGDAAYYMYLAADDYWTITRLHIKESSKSDSGLLQINGCLGIVINNCTFTDHSNANGMGARVMNISRVTFNGCTFKDNLKQNLHIVNQQVICNVYNCTFDGGVTTTDYGIVCEAAPFVFIEGCTFGSTTAHDTQDIYVLNCASIYTRNCTFNKATLSCAVQKGYIHSEDDDGTFGNQVNYYHNGTVIKSSTVRDGGATSSAQLLPTSVCSIEYPLTINGFVSRVVPDIAIYNTSTSEVNVDIYIRADSAWGTYPTAAQLYTEASYLSNAASATRSTVVSDEVLADDTTWVAFRTTMTPARAGWIYIKVYLGLYTATEGILVDIKPVVS